MIVDSQVHIWSATRPEDWPPGHRRLDAPGILREMDDAGVDGAVLITVERHGTANDVALAAAVEHPTRFRVVGRIDLAASATVAGLATWLDQPGMAGLRVTFQKPWSAPLLEDGSAAWLWPAAEVLGIPVMVYAPGQSAAVGRIAAAHPDLRLAVDHFNFRGGPGNTGLSVDDLLALAAYDNVSVKASSLPWFANDPYPYPSLHAPIRYVVEAFGPHRVFWGTDLTRLPCSYADAVRLFTAELDGLSGEAAELVMGRALARWLDWEPGIDTSIQEY